MYVYTDESAEIRVYGPCSMNVCPHWKDFPALESSSSAVCSRGAEGVGGRDKSA